LATSGTDDWRSLVDHHSRPSTAPKIHLKVNVADFSLRTAAFVSMRIETEQVIDSGLGECLAMKLKWHVDSESPESRGNSFPGRAVFGNLNLNFQNLSLHSSIVSYGINNKDAR